MWLCRIRFKHNCTVGNRMQKYGIMTHLTFLGTYKEKEKAYSIGMHRLIGEEKKIKQFFNDFRKDKDVVKSELNKNIMICTELNTRLPISKFQNKIFFQKPILIDKNGYEHWEFFSYDREILNKFITEAKKMCDFFEIQRLSNVKLNDFYFPHAIPQLTEKQKRAFELALEEGYYLIPRKTNIRLLAKIMGVSKSTYQDLLRRAESKIIPDLADMNIIE